jgi:hypothetical protein
MMAQRDHRIHHYLWHQVRNGWLFFDEATRATLRGLGWEPPRPSLRPTPGGGRAPVLDNDSGEDFLYMHRQMIALVDQRLGEIADPGYPRVQGWPSVPPPGEPDYPVPPAWDTGDPDLNGYLQETKSEPFFQQALAPWERQLKDPSWLQGRSLGEVGARIEFTIHNRMHMRRSSDPGQIRPDVDPAHPGDIDPRWDDPSYDWLGDTYSSHVHPVFWKMHGWVDDRIEDWKRSNEVTGPIPWKGTWVGQMPPHPAPNSLHAMLAGGHAHHDHGSGMKKALQATLRSGVRWHFHDRVELPD